MKCKKKEIPKNQKRAKTKEPLCLVKGHIHKERNYSKWL